MANRIAAFVGILIMAAVQARAYNSDRATRSSSNIQENAQEDDSPRSSTATTTLDEARGSFSTLVETYATQLGDPGGFIALKDPVTSRMINARIVRVNTASLRQTGDGIFTGEVILAAANGKPLLARAVADMSQSEWNVKSLELVRPPKPPQAKDIGRILYAAVLKEIQTATKRDGAFFVQDDATGYKRRLKLKMIPNDGTAPLGSSRYRCRVYMTDLQDGSSVDVDFFATLDGVSGQIDRVSLHGAEKP